MQPRVAVIGGGISGLAAAHCLRELAPWADVLLLESGQRLGGVLKTTRQSGFLIESAADNFITSTTAAIDLCQRLGLEDALIGLDKSCRQTWVLNKGQLQPIPAGFQVMAPSQLWPLLSSPILSLRGKLRAALEYFLPCKTSQEDESLQSFVCRRFGQELFERLVQPLIGSIYTADPNMLSIEATMPRFRQMEREHGSLIRAMLRNRREQPNRQQSGGKHDGQFATLREGMSSLIQALADRLPEDSVRFDSPVESMFSIDRNHCLLAIGGQHPQRLVVDGVIIATPAPQAARLLTDVDAALAAELRQIKYASCAVISLGFRRNQIERPLNGIGFVVPLVENRLILSCSYSSLKYPGRAPVDSVLLRVFIGGACQSGLLQLPREQLAELATREVVDLLHIRGEPTLRHVERQNCAMPQYHVGHRDRVARISQRLSRFPLLAMAGNSLYGVGVPGCIQSGEAAAAQIVSQLTRTTTTVLQTSRG